MFKKIICFKYFTIYLNWDTIYLTGIQYIRERGFKKLLKKIETMSIRESVFIQIRGLILNNELKPGERLSEAELAENLGVSRTPVREALHKLELEGLVAIHPRRYCQVIGITKDSIHEINLIRVKLEPIVSKDAVKYLTDEQIQYLKEMVEETKYHF